MCEAMCYTSVDKICNLLILIKIGRIYSDKSNYVKKN